MEMISEEILSSVLDFADDFVERFGDDACLLVHCHEGISRSSAIAHREADLFEIAIYVALYGDPKNAVTMIAQGRPQAVPNIETIRLSDSFLNMQGTLLNAVEEVFYSSLMEIVDII